MSAAVVSQLVSQQPVVSELGAHEEKSLRNKSYSLIILLDEQITICPQQLIAIVTLSLIKENVFHCSVSGAARRGLQEWKTTVTVVS